MIIALLEPAPRMVEMNPAPSKGAGLRPAKIPLRGRFAPSVNDRGDGGATKLSELSV